MTKPESLVARLRPQLTTVPDHENFRGPPLDITELTAHFFPVHTPPKAGRLQYLGV